MVWALVVCSADQTRSPICWLPPPGPPSPPQPPPATAPPSAATTAIPRPATGRIRNRTSAAATAAIRAFIGLPPAPLPRPAAMFRAAAGGDLAGGAVFELAGLDVGQARSTIANKAGVIAHFYDFVITRYQGDVHRLVGWVVVQPIDEYNRPTRASSQAERVPPGDDEVEELFTQWGKAVVHARKYLPAARDYFAASLWRRLGLRITESVMLDIRDWRPDLGRQGKLHVRYGKGSGGRGPKPRLVPAINSADTLIDWWLAEVRPRYGPDWEDPDAPMLPSERVSSDVRRRRVGAEALRVGLAASNFRMVARLEQRPTHSARAAPLLRLLVVWPRDGPQGSAGVAGARVAVHHNPLRARAQRPHRTSLDRRQPASRPPARRQRTVNRCAGTCG